MRCRLRADDRGSAAVEFAVALPAVVLVLALCLGGVGVGAQQLRLHDAVADAARALGRGDASPAVAEGSAARSPGAVLEHWTADDLVCARLAAPARGPLGALGLRLDAVACAASGGR